MARRLLDTGHELAVWNRTPARAAALADRARVASSPADAARGAEALVTMVATPEALDEVLFGEDGAAEAMPAGAALIEMSTIGPDHVAAVAARLPAGVEMVDAPVLGNVGDAEAGSLRVFVGATEEGFERWRELLSAMGTPIHVGPLGAGAAMKLVANSTLAALMCTIGEALGLADAFGLDLERTTQVLLGSRIGPALEPKIDNVLSGAYPPRFRLTLMRKDLDLIRSAAERRGLKLPLAEAAARWFGSGEAKGLGDLDYSAVIALIRGKRPTG
jgi:3-hydroxyisobutyrate dehydrogenase/2-hydroxy-3-oxopropionate reductase